MLFRSVFFYDITKWSDSEKKTAKDKVALYKEIRPLVQQGTAYRLISPFENDRCAVSYVNDDASAAVVFCYSLADYLQRGPLDARGERTFQLRGLDDEKQYRIEYCGLPADKQPNGYFSGKYLKGAGIGWPVRGFEKSRIIRLTEVK